MRALVTVPEAHISHTGNREDGARIMRPLPEPAIEQLAELWCDVFMANLRRHPLSAVDANACDLETR